MTLYGNDNLAYVTGGQFLTVDGTSDTVTVKAGIRTVDLYSTTDCWVVIGEPGKDPTAAAPGAEKTEVSGFFLPASTVYNVALPLSFDSKQVKIAAIQSSAGGTLYVNYRDI